MSATVPQTGWTLRRAALWIAVSAYASLPWVTGAWFHGSIDCVYMWRETFRYGFSTLGFFALPLWIYVARHPEARAKDSYAAVVFMIAVLAVSAASNVVSSCW